MEMKIRFSITVVVFAGCVFLQTASAAAPWWDNFPRIVNCTTTNVMTNYHGTVAFDDVAKDPSWGTFYQSYSIQLPVNVAEATNFVAAGMKQIAYFETYGQTYCPVIEIGAWNETNLTPIIHTHWSWRLYSGGTIRWAGAKNFFDDEDFARPYTRTHPRYGGPPMTYPDGTVATGYNGPDTDPRNSRVYDAGCSKDVFGNLMIDSYSYVTGAKTNGLLPIVTGSGVNKTTNYSGLVMFKKDSACPAWTDYSRASALQAADAGLDGMWTDNYGPWDSFGNPPVKIAFGEWSVARFRGYLTNHFSTAELAGLGVTNTATFDIRSNMTATAKILKSSWNGTSLTDAVWTNSAWTDDALWRAYMIFKRQAGTEALSNYYAAVKSAALAGGKPEFLIAGNDIPGFQMGWTRGTLDMVSTELQIGYKPSNGSTGITLPPIGRFAPFYKLAREHAQSRFVNVWLYNDDFTNELTHADLCNVLYYEMLATHTLPKLDPSNVRITGDPVVNEAFFRFVEQAGAVYGARVPIEDVGVYYSSSSILRRFMPGGFQNMNLQPHQFAVWGWGTALGELHYQYRMVPEWKLTSELLATLRVLIVPEAEVFDPADVAVLTPWVSAGGVLIVTGNSGNFLGEAGNFNSNTNGYSLASLTSVVSTNSAPVQTNRTVGSGEVLYLRDNVGLNYYLAYSNRPALLGSFSNALSSALSGKPPVKLVAPGASSRTGLTLYQDETAGKYFIDVNNFDVDLTTYTVMPAAPVSATVELPVWLRGEVLQATTISPQTSAVPVALDSPWTTNSITVSVGPVEHYAGVTIGKSPGWAAWQSANFTAGEIAAGLAKGDQDPDQDGYMNYEEFVAGTNPERADSVLTLGIKSAALTGRMDLSFPTVSNRSYSLLGRTNLLNGTWSLIESNLSGTGSFVTVTPSNLEPSAFYRIEVSAH